MSDPVSTTTAFISLYGQRKAQNLKSDLAKIQSEPFSSFGEELKKELACDKTPPGGTAHLNLPRPEAPIHLRQSRPPRPWRCQSYPAACRSRTRRTSSMRSSGASHRGSLGHHVIDEATSTLLLYHSPPPPPLYIAAHPLRPGRSICGPDLHLAIQF